MLFFFVFLAIYISLWYCLFSPWKEKIMFKNIPYLIFVVIILVLIYLLFLAPSEFMIVLGGIFAASILLFPLAILIVSGVFILLKDYEKQ